MATACSATECGEYLARARHAAQTALSLPARTPHTAPRSHSYLRCKACRFSDSRVRGSSSTCRSAAPLSAKRCRGTRGDARHADARRSGRRKVDPVVACAPHRLHQRCCQMVGYLRDEQAELCVSAAGGAEAWPHQEADTASGQALHDCCGCCVVHEQARRVIAGRQPRCVLVQRCLKEGRIQGRVTEGLLQEVADLRCTPVRGRAAPQWQ